MHQSRCENEKLRTTRTLFDDKSPFKTDGHLDPVTDSCTVIQQTEKKIQALRGDAKHVTLQAVLTAQLQFQELNALRPEQLKETSQLTKIN